MKRSYLKRRTRLRSRTRIRARNPKRIKKLRAKQFGTDGYREHILGLRCVVTGAWPVDPAHVLGRRSTGHGPEGLAPLVRRVHDAFDNIGEARFAELYGVTKEWIRDWARKHRAEWEANQGEV